MIYHYGDFFQKRQKGGFWTTDFSRNNKTNNSSENENSNKLEDVTGMDEVNLISLENKKDGEKRQNKKKEHTINSDQDENDDIEVCSFYEGEFVLPEGARLIRSYTFDQSYIGSN